MTSQGKLESLIRRAAELPEDAQAELARSIAERIFYLDAEEPCAEPAGA